MQHKHEVLKYESEKQSGQKLHCYTGKEVYDMTSENKEILDRINAYAEKVLADIDPQKTRISFQLEALKPVMQEIADEKNVSVEDIFILYMDLASEAATEAENHLQAALEEEGGADFSKIANRLN